MNSLFVIAPYRYQGYWVFDDPSTGLVREPFVSGADKILDLMAADIANARDDGFRLLFAAAPFPGFMVQVRKTREDFGGTWYQWDEKGIEGWLCPALFKYFPVAPENIYFRADAKTD